MRVTQQLMQINSDKAVTDPHQAGRYRSLYFSQTIASSLQPDAIRKELQLGDPKAPESARQAAQQFEALLLNEMIKAMRATEMESGLFSSQQTRMYREMFDTQLAQRISEAGGIGLASVIHYQLVRQALNEGEGEMTPAGSALEETVAPLPSLSLISRAIKALGPHRSAEVTAASAPVSLHLPVEGRISSRFGARRDPIYGRVHHHQGLDIAAPRGTPIRAAADGVVVFSGYQRGYGRTVVIEHADGTRTRYAHAEELFIKHGEYVTAQQEIASIGSSGRATGPHLHFEVVRNGRRIDPEAILAQVSMLARR